MKSPNKTLELISRETGLEIEEDYRRGYSLIDTKSFAHFEDHLSKVEIYDVYQVEGSPPPVSKEIADEKVQNPIEQFKLIQKELAKNWTGSCGDSAPLYADIDAEYKETKNKSENKCLSRFVDVFKCLPKGSIVCSIDTDLKGDEKDDEFEWLSRRSLDLAENFVEKVEKTPKYLSRECPNFDNPAIKQKFDELNKQLEQIKNLKEEEFEFCKGKN